MNLDKRLFQSLSKQNFLVKYQSQNQNNKKEKYQQKIYQINKQLNKNNELNINKFEKFFEYKQIDQDNNSILNRESSCNSRNFSNKKENNENQSNKSQDEVKIQNQFQQSYGSGFTRNTQRFERKSSYFFREENQKKFMKNISKQHSFAFKSLPRNVLKAKEVEQTEERLKQILRKEDYKYTISPLVQQERFSQKTQENFFSHQKDKSEKEQIILQNLNFDVIKNMHNYSNTDQNQKELKEQVLKFREWKNSVIERKRFQKIVKLKFKSGILNLDGPLNQQTNLYFEERQELNRKLQKTKNQQDIHKRNLASVQGTHQFIDISNYYNNLNQQNPIDQRLTVPIKQNDGELILQKKHKFDIDYLKYFQDSTQYDGIKKQQSKIEKRQLRKLNLQNQELRGKSYDIVTHKEIV